jgi:hypothetical protein
LVHNTTATILQRQAGMRVRIERTSGEARGEGYVGNSGRLRKGGRLGNCGRIWEKRQVVELAGTYLTLGEGRNWFFAYGGCLSAVEDAGVASSSVRVRMCGPKNGIK